MRPAILLTATLLAAAMSWWPPAVVGDTPDRYLFRVWRIEDGLPQTSIFALAQDRDGYLWTGTLEGLARFDGLDFQVFDRRNTPALTSNLVRDLLADPEGNLWIATAGGLLRHQDGQFVRFPAPEGWPASDLEALHLDRQGRLWLGGPYGLSRLEGRTFVTDTTPDGLADHHVVAIHEDRRGNLWIATTVGLSRLYDGGLRSYTTADGLRHNHVRAIREDRRGRLWVGTMEGLHRLEDGRFIPIPLPDGLSRSLVHAILEDRSGTVWVGTESGLIRLRDESSAVFRRSDGLPDDRIEVLWEDGDGNLWIGTRFGGLCQMIPQRIANFGVAEGLADPVTWTIFEDRAGNVWLGTNGGLTRLAGDGSVTTYTTRDGLPSNEVWALAEDRQGTLWIGTNLGGLAMLRGGTDRVEPVTAKLAHPTVSSLLADPEGSLWIGTYGGLYRLVAGKLVIFTTRDGLPHDQVRDLCRDSRGVVWIATAGGLVGHEDGVLTALTTRDGLAHDSVWALHAASDGSLWIGTEGGGLSRLRDGKLTTLTEENGLFDDLVHRILEDSRGRLWMTSNRGIFTVGIDQLDDFAAGRRGGVRSLSYGTADGMRASECNGRGHPAGWRMRDGKLWFPTINGAAIVDPEHVDGAEAPPRPVIEEVLIGNRRVNPNQRQVLAPGTRPFIFRFAAPYFLMPEKTRFRVMLEGYDDGWVEVGSQRFFVYPRLPPGEYCFRVIAGTSDEVWSEAGDSFSFLLRPALYQTWPFYLTCAVAVVLAGLGFHRFQLRQLVRHNQQLHAMKEQLEAKNVELEDRRQEMERFTYAVSHDLKSPLFTIQGFVSLLEKDAERGDRERMAGDLARIRTAATTMGRLLEELLELSRLGRVSREPEQLGLEKLAREAVELVAGHIAERGVEVLIRPPLPVVWGDRARLVRVLQNLIANAVKFMGPQERPRIEITGGLDDGDPVCRVRDNGIGIEPGFHEKVFGLFNQLDPNVEGTGLGLAVVKRIIALHGGRVWVESAGPGQGSTFSFTLPRQPESDAREA